MKRTRKYRVCKDCFENFLPTNVYAVGVAL